MEIITDELMNSTNKRGGHKTRNIQAYSA